MTDRPRALIVDLARKLGGASTRALGLATGLTGERAALACLTESAVHEAAVARGRSGPGATLGSRCLDSRSVLFPCVSFPMN